MPKKVGKVGRAYFSAKTVDKLSLKVYHILPHKTHLKEANMAEKKSSDREEKKERKNLAKSSNQKSTPSACKACGGPYPLCKDGCALFDDD